MLRPPGMRRAGSGDRDLCCDLADTAVELGADMNNMVQGFLDNDSFFGRFMTKLGIIIAANIMFVLLSIPFFTIGAGFSALYYVMFRTLRSEGVVNPFKEFWTGLRVNFKQATISWILFVLLRVCHRSCCDHLVSLPDPCYDGF